VKTFRDSRGMTTMTEERRLPVFSVADWQEPVKRRKKSKRGVTKEEAFRRGRKAAVDRKARTDIPYRDAIMAREWERGYDHELRLSAGRSSGLL
jgi:hypothetical protein